MTANGVGILVDVGATLDRATRTVTLTLEAVDPATGWFPEDPLSGLLDSDDGNGTAVENRATIVFDYNDPIDTPLVRNTLDAAGPTRRVTTPTGTNTGDSLTQNWTGADDPAGSAVAAGHTYGFCSVATDLVGHVESATLAPDTVIVVEGTVPGTG